MILCENIIIYTFRGNIVVNIIICKKCFITFGCKSLIVQELIINMCWIQAGSLLLVKETPMLLNLLTYYEIY